MNYHVTVKEFDDFKGFSHRRVLSVTNAFSSVQEWIGLNRRSKPSEIDQLGSHNVNPYLNVPVTQKLRCTVDMYKAYHCCSHASRLPI